MDIDREHRITDVIGKSSEQEEYALQIFGHSTNIWPSVARRPAT
jgi:hypothetical protein